MWATFQTYRIPSASSPILVKTIDEELPICPPASPLIYPPREQPIAESPFRPPARPIVYPPRESPLFSPREYLPTSSSESALLVSWREPIDKSRPHREVRQESVPTRVSQLSNPSSLCRSARSNPRQAPNCLIYDSSDTINLGTEPSREAAANLVSSSKENPSLSSHSSEIVEGRYRCLSTSSQPRASLKRYR